MASSTKHDVLKRDSPFFISSNMTQGRITYQYDPGHEPSAKDFDQRFKNHNKKHKLPKFFYHIYESDIYIFF